MKKNHPVPKNFKNSSWSKPSFLPGLKYFLAQHLVETQICTLSKIFRVKKSTPKVGTSPYDRKPKYPPPGQGEVLLWLTQVRSETLCLMLQIMQFCLLQIL